MCILYFTFKVPSNNSGDFYYLYDYAILWKCLPFHLIFLSTISNWYISYFDGMSSSSSYLTCLVYKHLEEKEGNQNTSPKSPKLAERPISCGAGRMTGKYIWDSWTACTKHVGNCSTCTGAVTVMNRSPLLLQTLLAGREEASLVIKLQIPRHPQGIIPYGI